MNLLVGLAERVKVGHPYPVREDWEALGNAVRKRRIELGYSDRRDLATEIKISDRTLGALERGERRVSRSTLLDVEDGLGWTRGTATRVLQGGDPPAATPRTPQYPEIVVSADLPNPHLVEILGTLERIHGEDAVLEALAALRRSRDGKRQRGSAPPADADA